ncbi:MAG: alpha-hydroxy-acid oxidizing protein [Rhodocyclaceae bacterium]|nr:alpha-hydroxy-acid oxidizing protein [Rhodocyclaceae bacterium]
MTLATLTAIPQDIVSFHDYERHARVHLDDNAWTYLSCGAADELTLHYNQRAFQHIGLRNRVLAEVTGGHTRMTLLGETHAHPIFLAPVAYQKLFHTDGECAAALGAAAIEAGMVLSSLASTELKTVASINPRLWFQLYLQRKREHTLTLVRRAEAAGCRALVVTVDAPITGVRNREQRIGFHLPPGVSAVNLSLLAETVLPQPLQAGQSVIFDQLMQGAPGWHDIEWLVGSTSLPVLLKGILTSEDASRAVDAGVAGIVVSNHGGRILDTVPATITVLPEVVEAVGGRVPVLIDGGIRRGSDVFKALALGASAVLIGRPYVYALATAGALGVAHLVRTLREELETTMVLCGCRTLSDIDQTRVSFN